MLSWLRGYLGCVLADCIGSSVDADFLLDLRLGETNTISDVNLSVPITLGFIASPGSGGPARMPLCTRVIYEYPGAFGILENEYGFHVYIYICTSIRIPVLYEVPRGAMLKNARAMQNILQPIRFHRT